MADRICIVAARRTPQGRLLGALADYTAVALAEHAARPLLDVVPPEQVTPKNTTPQQQARPIHLAGVFIEGEQHPVGLGSLAAPPGKLGPQTFDVVIRQCAHT